MLQNLQPPWEMLFSKYKHAWYQLRNFWNRHWKFIYLPLSTSLLIGVLSYFDVLDLEQVCIQIQTWDDPLILFEGACNFNHGYLSAAQNNQLYVTFELMVQCLTQEHNMLEGSAGLEPTTFGLRVGTFIHCATCAHNGFHGHGKPLTALSGRQCRKHSIVNYLSIDVIYGSNWTSHIELWLILDPMNDIWFDGQLKAMGSWSSDWDTRLSSWSWCYVVSPPERLWCQRVF